MGILRSIIQSFVLSMFYAFQHLFLCRFVTRELVGDDDSWCETLLLEQLAKETLGCLCISLSLHQDIQHGPLCIHCPPQIVLLFLNFDHYFIKMPFIRNIRTLAPQLIRVLLSEL